MISMTSEAPAIDLQRLSDALIDGAAELPAWETFLPLLRRSTSADCAFILLEAQGGKSTYPLLFASGASEESILDLHANGIASNQESDLVHSGEGVATFRGQHGIKTYAGLSTSTKACGRICLGLCWPGRDDPPGEAMSFLKSLVPVFIRTIKIFMRIVEVERRAATFETVADHVDAGVVLVTRKGDVTVCSKAARAMLAQSGAARISGGRLTVAEPSAHRSLMQEIDRAIAGQSSGIMFDGMPTSFTPKSDGVSLTAMVYPGPRHVGARGPVRETAIIVLRDPSRKPRIPVNHVASLLRLTPAEAVLATRLAEGLSLTEIAAMNGVKHNTIRCQLQAVYMKTGTKRQGDLVRLICNSAASLS